ncbi:Na+/H+ antiporter NhaA [Aliiroseovarius subalbicans]|uniref:Na+/H+ antiporter NhaA n=1 Tax=Aliiroseovarius subalbicans TaxID=2925840 RepID=UPI001F561610|nr:Na+/H+ antiporter NhaA [Aliiroseovarius subalbicans]MCI2399924.1 Na+/H+ antiporter NhaA [Aliiroseovarius subalbicans]
MASKQPPDFDVERDFVIGDPDATTTLVWFVDFTDRPTRRMRGVIKRSAARFAQKRAALVIRYLPRSTRGSEIAARAAIAAHAQGKHMAMHNALFSSGRRYSKDLVIELAELLDLDIQQFRADLKSEETTRRLAEDLATADEMGALQTPALFIGDREYDGAWDETSLIEAIRKPLGVRLHLVSTEFVQWAASAGFALVLATLAALVVANVGLHDGYEHLRETVIGLSAGNWGFHLPLEMWINDALMALFFLLVGIEIKREMVGGELSDLSHAALPIVGAIGGMLVPAGIYFAINYGTPTAHGWGIPMATDIAFTLGIMALLGDRVPTSLKVFVSALAIADDLGAILVIAAFYGHGFHLDAFLVAVALFIVMLALNRGRIYARFPYLILMVFMWYFIHESGLHATLAGVLTAAAIPSRRSANVEGIAAQTSALFKLEAQRPDVPVTPGTVARLQASIDRLRDPGFHLQHALENWSNFLILPLFAFFNTGIVILGSSFDAFAPEALGVMAGLVIGKPLGVFLAVFLAVKLGLAQMSDDVNWVQILGAGMLAGVGFTMSIFIGTASFEGPQLDGVKLAILIASLVSAVGGAAVLWMAGRTR